MKFRTIVLITVIGLIGLSSCGISNRTDRILERDFPVGTPGIAVGILKKGEVVYSNGFGDASIEEQRPFSAQTVSNLGGVSQVITAVAVLQLAERGDISLSDSITQYFSDVPSEWEPITIQHLLDHTSGLLDYYRFIEEMTDNAFEFLQVRIITSSGIKGYNKHIYEPEQYEGVDNDWVLQTLIEQGAPPNAPGSIYEYINSNYVLLSMIVEKASGETFENFVKKNIFDPIEMNSSFVSRTKPSGDSNIASSYRVKFDKYDYFWATPETTGDSNVYTTVEDMLKFLQAFSDNKLIKAESVEQIYARYDKIQKRFSRGLFLRYYIKEAMMADHGGGAGGFRAYLVMVPDRDLAAISLTNGSHDTLDEATEILIYNAF
jgi:CubicO group peptidase (beta-lactamase class C family)